MPATAIQHPPLPDLGIRRKLWTVDELHRVLDIGLFDDQTFELIQGEILDLAGHKSLHTSAFIPILRWLQTFVEIERIGVEKPVSLLGAGGQTSEPQPDIMVYTTSEDDLFDRQPLPSEVQLVVELADTSFPLDSTTKRDLYARSGIVEYWLFNLNRPSLIVHRNPQNGAYLDVSRLDLSDRVSPIFAPAQTVDVASLFAPKLRAKQ